MSELTYNLVPTNFEYPEAKDTDYIFGSEQLVGTVLNESGDWRDYTPPEELQRRNGVESASCFVQAQQHTLATILEEQFGIADNDFSERFNFIFSDPTPQGGSPIKGAQAIRDYGLIPDSMLPFSDFIKTWLEFRSFDGADEVKCVAKGQEWLKNWKPGYDTVITKELSVATKYERLKSALKYSPIPISVYAWVQDREGNYVKPVGEKDNHLVELVYIDDNNCPWIFDTYPPFIKKLSPKYDFSFGMRWSIEKKEIIEQKYWFTEIFRNIIRLIKDILWQ